MRAFVSLEFERLRFLGRRKTEKNHHVIVLEGTFGDKKRVVLASSDEFNSLSFVQVIGKLTFMNEPLQFKQHCWLIKRKYRNSTDYINMLDGFLSEYEEVCQFG